MKHPRSLRARVRVSLSILSLAPLLGACGLGAASLFGGSSSSKANARPVGSALQVPRVASGAATIGFVVNDQEGNPVDVELSFRSGAAGAFQPITLAAGSNPLENVPTNGGVYEVQWDFTADLGDESYRDDVEVELTVVGGIAPVRLTGVEIGNDPPEILAGGEPAPDPPGRSEYFGNTDVRFMLADSAVDRVRVRVEYNAASDAGFPEAQWRLARPAATPSAEPTPEFALVELEPSAGGTAFVFRWDSTFDLAGFDSNVKMRMTPEDAFAAGVTIEGGPFRVDNNQRPFAVLDEGAFVLNTDERGVVPVPFRLFDDEADPLRVGVQWTREGEPFPDLAPGELGTLLAASGDPASERRKADLQLAVEAPRRFGGSVGAPFAGQADDEVRVPELAASGALARELANQTFDLLRASTIPASVWATRPLTGAVAATPGEDGLSAFVLETDAGGWRVREVALETGAVLRTVANGSGAPRALALDVTRHHGGPVDLGHGHLWVGTSGDIHRLALPDGTLEGSIPHAFVDGPRALAVLGLEQALGTGDDALASFDLGVGAATPATTLLTGLFEPHGIVRDPRSGGRVLLAERSADRVVALDLEKLVLRAVPARVAPDDVATLGATALPSPGALALARRGTRLLVVVESASGPALRELPLGSPDDVEVPPDGGADAFVHEVTGAGVASNSALATGPDGLTLVTLPDTLLLGGGIAQRRRIVPQSATGADPQPYDALRGLVTLDTPLVPPARAGDRWRISQRAALLESDPNGATQVFLWDTASAPAVGDVRLRVLPIDGDDGVPATASTPKTIRLALETDPSSFPATLLPEAVVAGDFDGDEDLDVVVLERPPFMFPAAPVVRVLEQVRPGVFQSGLVQNLRHIPIGADALDLDGDGLDDLVIQMEDFGFTILFQDAPGSFSAPLDIPLGNPDLISVATPAIADFDGDGDLDLVTSNRFGGGVLLFLQTAPRLFDPPVNTAVGTRPGPMVSGDVDGDGDLDIAGLDFSGGAIQILANDGAGAFTLLGEVATDSGPTDPHLVDVDADGRLDLLHATNLSDEVRLHMGDGTGAFTPGPILEAGANLSRVITGDLNGDGRVDLGGVDSIAGIVTVYLAESTGAGTRFVRGPLLALGGGSRDTLLVDLDANGALDLVSANGADGHSTILIAEEADTFRAREELATQSFAGDLAIADLDGSGSLDLALVRRLENDVMLWFQTVPGEFLPGPSVAVGDEPFSLLAADLDGDGDVDLATTNPGSQDVTLLFQDASGTFVPAGATLPTGQFCRSLTAVDLDQDGDLDLALVDTNLALYFQTAPGEFVPGAVLPVGSPIRLMTGDFDADGDVDLATLGGQLSLFLQSTPGTFVTGPTLPMPSANLPNAVACADLDGDGDLDFVVARTPDLLLFLQTTPGDFTLGPALPVVGTAFRIVPRDLDGDGDVDLACTNTNEQTVSFYTQVSPGRFGEPEVISLSGGPHAIVAADLEADGDLDLVIARGFGEALSILYGGH